MPENLYFREPHTQNMLLDILFIYCKLNRDIGYRQGMHEVLAPILWVVSRDAIDSQSLGPDHADLDGLTLASLDNRYVEHDAFTLFGAIMQTVKTFYEMGSNNEPATTGLLNNSPIVERSKRIHENYLHHADPELAEHLTAIEILPQIFLIRWVRLLFGREFPLEDVLALWDILFAEDPALDLVDLISVSMLLRIRWQLLEADYSAALTLLLRYPIPTAPYGPSTFVGDALYLRDNLLLDGGDHIISKYSRRAPETTVTRKLPKKIRRARTAEQTAAQKAVPQKASSPRLSPARILQHQGGIEGIIHEAAKGVYNQGERWGVAKALRGAVQGLQSGNNSPRRQPEKSRWSLDSGKNVSDSPKDLIAKIQLFEERNKSLAKLLEKAMEELWAQQKDMNTKPNETTADALSLAIAKVQFVQVYLENSTMPLPSESLPPEEKNHDGPVETDAGLTPSSPGPPSDQIQSDGATDEKLASEGVHTVGIVNPSVRWPPAPVKTLPSTPRAGSPSKSKGLLPFSQARPALAQSSFSWMLGEDQQKSSFVSGSPFPSERTGGRRKGGDLFGDEKREGSNKRRGSNPNGDGDKNDDDADVFTLGTLKGGRQK